MYRVGTFIVLWEIGGVITLMSESFVIFVLHFDSHNFGSVYRIFVYE